MRHYAHSLKGADESKWQPLSEHLLAVAELAERFAREARPSDEDFAEAARMAGVPHDLGKYRPDFQAMVRGSPTSPATCHNLTGAAWAAERNGTDLAFASFGDHGGIGNRAARQLGASCSIISATKPIKEPALPGPDGQIAGLIKGNPRHMISIRRRAVTRRKKLCRTT